MTQEQKKNIKLGRSYLNAISTQDIKRRNDWIENNLPQVLDLALKQADDLTKMQSEIDEFSYKLRETYVEIDELKAELERLRQLPDLVESVSQWGIQKGITGPNGKATLYTQAQKMMEEAEETMDAISDWNRAALNCDDWQKQNCKPEIIDGIGDTTVTLILLSDLLGVPFAQCLQAAYDEIKGRTGQMVDGVFVKDGGKSEPSTLGIP